LPGLTRVVRRIEPIGIDGGLGGLAGSLAEGREGNTPALAGTPRLRPIDQDPEDPGFEGGARFKAIEPGKDTHPGFLHDLLSDRTVGDIEERQAQE
jgi:hypothetical protein